jgi:hypothetical protein
MNQHCRGRARPAVVGCFALGVLVAFTAGCGPGRGKVSGRALYKNRALPGGFVTFRPADPRENPITVPISPEGQYEATLPTGQVRISVDNRELEPVKSMPPPTLPPEIKLPPRPPAPEAKPGPEKGTASQKPPGTYVPIPDKYYSTDTSGLSYTVKSGSQSHDIVLE